MNHRERIITALQHQQPDRIPVDLGGTRSTTMNALAYARLKEHLSITDGNTFVFDPYLQLAYIEEPIKERFGVDTAILNSGLLGGWREGFLPDGSRAKFAGGFRSAPDGAGGEYALDMLGRRTWHRPSNSHYFDPIYWPLADAASSADLDAYAWPRWSDESLYRLQLEARRLFNETDYAVIGEMGGDFLEAGQWLRGYSNFMMDLAGNRAFVEALLDRVLENHLRNAELYLQAVGEFLQIIQMNDDLGTQTGPQIRPKMYYELIQPRQKVLWSRIHALQPRAALFLHSCGAVADLIPGLIDAGLDILNPVQISAKGMDPARLKAEFGAQLCFWGGGCDTQHVLPFGSPQEVYEHTRGNIAVLKSGGGFVFSQVHNIQPNTPPENIAAMFQAVKDSWNYSL